MRVGEQGRVDKSATEIYPAVFREACDVCKPVVIGDGLVHLHLPPERWKMEVSQTAHEALVAFCLLWERRKSVDNWPSVLFAMAGGIVLSLGNLSTQYAWAYVGLSVTESVQPTMAVHWSLENYKQKVRILILGIGGLSVEVNPLVIFGAKADSPGVKPRFTSFHCPLAGHFFSLTITSYRTSPSPSLLHKTVGHSSPPLQHFPSLLHGQPFPLKSH
ncbi:Ureide permease 2 [Platanthera guangdongensis]|uniref:Ureide permease 2 n=1 Tax=Platanthera guangdongensis TaxID=2320717 RepID=A0ABR2M2G2_9ASPA